MDWLLTRRASLSRAGKRVSQCVHQHRGSQNLPGARRERFAVAGLTATAIVEC
jgi:hypothetical protein